MSTEKHGAFKATFEGSVIRHKSVQITLKDSQGGIAAATFLAECCKRKIVCLPETVEHLSSARKFAVWKYDWHRTFNFSVLVGQLTAKELAEGIGLENIESLELVVGK